MTRGFFEIGIYHPKTETNVGTLWRSAYQLGASGIFTIGARYTPQCSDTTMSFRHIPLRNYQTFDEFQEHRPFGARLVGIEMGGRLINNYCHPEQAVYLLGAEDNGLPQDIIDKCQSLISLEATRMLSFNVAVAGSIIMYHRQFLQAKFVNADR